MNAIFAISRRSVDYAPSPVTFHMREVEFFRVLSNNRRAGRSSEGNRGIDKVALLFSAFSYSSFKRTTAMRAGNQF